MRTEASSSAPAILGLLLLAGIILLQIFLSKKENKWPGLVMPGISLVMALMYPLLMYAPMNQSAMEVILNMVLIFLMANIPTYVLLAIYFACRGKYRRKKQMDKMNIHDL